jgi:hypothetical protein
MNKSKLFKFVSDITTQTNFRIKNTTSEIQSTADKKKVLVYTHVMVKLRFTIPYEQFMKHLFFRMTQSDFVLMNNLSEAYSSYWHTVDCIFMHVCNLFCE